MLLLSRDGKDKNKNFYICIVTLSICLFEAGVTYFLCPTGLLIAMNIVLLCKF